MGRVPNNDQNFLPDIPTQSGDFAGLRRFLQGARAAIQGYIQNPDAPDMVTGLRVSTDTGGVILRWEPSNRATAYIIYRAFDSNSFSNASAIATIARANNLIFFDPNGQNANATTRYYWVVATNGPVTAPISISVSTPEVAASTGGGTTIGDLLKNVTRQRQISPIGTLDAAAAPSSTDTVNMKVTIGTTKNWVTGTRVTVNSTANGLTAGTNYYLGRFSGTIFAFYTDVQNAVDDVSRVTLTGSISATITPDAVVFCTFPSNAVSALMTTMNEGQGGNWLVRTLGVAPTTSVYSAKLAPGDTTLSTLGWAFSEEAPPIGDVCVFHDDPTNVNAGVFSGYAGWNDGTSPLIGLTGPAGAAGRGYKATSVTSLTIANSGSVTFVTQTNLAYTVGARIRATSTGSAAWMEGVVTGYTEFVGSANLVVTMDLDSGSGTHTDWDINAAGVKGDTGTAGATGAPGPTGATGTGGSPSTNDFRLTLASGLPVYNPQIATPSSTNTSTEIVTFTNDPGWVTGTIVTPLTTVGGLTAGTKYFYGRLSPTTGAFYTTVANANANTSKVDLTASITSSLIPTGISQTTLYFTPHRGNVVDLYDGVSAWANFTSAEISIALGTLTSGKNYDVFVFNSSGLVLELVAWTDDVTRATALVRQDGIFVKTGTTTKRYVGTIRTDSTTTTIDDGGGIISQTGGKRFVANAYNTVKAGVRVIDKTGSWTYSTNTWRQANGNAGNQVEWVSPLGLDTIHATLSVATSQSSSSTEASVSFGLDQTTDGLIELSAVATSVAQAVVSISTSIARPVTAGYHKLCWLEKGDGTATSTFVGADADRRSALAGTVEV